MQLVDQSSYKRPVASTVQAAPNFFFEKAGSTEVAIWSVNGLCIALQISPTPIVTSEEFVEQDPVIVYPDISIFNLFRAPVPEQPVSRSRKIALNHDF